MRIFSALAGALLITVAIFLLMHSLIQQGKEEGVQLAVYNDIRIVHRDPEDEPPETQPDENPEPQEEPTMEPLALSATALAPVPAETLELPALELGPGEIDIATVGGSWRAPAVSGGIDVGIGGVDAQGYIEVVPFDTRRPNVPEVAWQNKIDGWVLVAFSVTPNGRTRAVRVLDASPRGVFEEKVIAAVEDWTYRISFSGNVQGDVVLTQKVEVRWKNFPQNLPNVD
jgi:protein TonB